MIDLAIIHSRHWAGLDVTDDEYSEVIDRAIAAEEENESLKSRLQAAESKLEEMANSKVEPISYEQMIDHEWVKISKTRFEQLEGCSWIQKRELYLHPQVQSNADKEITFEDWLNTPIGLQVRNFDILALSAYEEVYIARLKAAFNAKSIFNMEI